MAILIYRKSMNKSYDEISKELKSYLMKYIGPRYYITATLWIAPESTNIDKYDANLFLNHVTESEINEFEYYYRMI